MEGEGRHGRRQAWTPPSAAGMIGAGMDAMRRVRGFGARLAWECDEMPRAHDSRVVAAAVSLRRLVAKAADALLDERQVRVVRIKGDGRCMFRAIARNLAAFDGRNLSEGAERQDADFLRNAAYKVVCVEKKKEFQASYLIEGNIDHYCAQMRSPSFYGGETEMFILADLLQKPIAVYLPAGRSQFQKIICYGEKYLKKMPNGRSETIKLLYNGTNHYEALIDRC
ncbi:OTU domain-containing protein [Porphyridium purpureum]|uniref:Ubiquitin thioesterase OTU n=1 Tax=Porphyridium purpureum TaxID=35688 RepID=A0A5J4Z7U5_PORPP|nr:OTU domain-containing protein [Porphyridium purpureum]|eukprot:POR2902..scf295_1